MSNQALTKKDFKEYMDGFNENIQKSFLNKKDFENYMDRFAVSIQKNFLTKKDFEKYMDGFAGSIQKSFNEASSEREAFKKEANDRFKQLVNGHNKIGSDLLSLKQEYIFIRHRTDLLEAEMERAENGRKLKFKPIT